MLKELDEQWIGDMRLPGWSRRRMGCCVRGAMRARRAPRGAEVAGGQRGLGRGGLGRGGVERRAVLAPGTDIGPGAIVALGALVSGSVPAGVIVRGNPAVVVGKR